MKPRRNILAGNADLADALRLGLGACLARAYQRGHHRSSPATPRHVSVRRLFSPAPRRRATRDTWATSHRAPADRARPLHRWPPTLLTSLLIWRKRNASTSRIRYGANHRPLPRSGPTRRSLGRMQMPWKGGESHPSMDSGTPQPRAAC